MSKRYDEVMEKIEVTEAMRQRILANLDAMELDTAARSRVRRFPAARRLMPIAACFVLLLAGVFALRHYTPGEIIEPWPSEDVSTVNGIVDVADVDELGEAVGFSVKELTSLPFQVSEVAYTSYWDELAQIIYRGEGQALTFRQSVGDEDNSGDYNVYAEAMEAELGGVSVTLKGDGGTYSLAIWNDGEYAYSASAEPGFTLTQWETILSSLD